MRRLSTVLILAICATVLWSVRPRGVRTAAEDIVPTVTAHQEGVLVLDLMDDLSPEEVASLEDIDLLEKLGLTHREAEVLSWVAKGKQNSDVAAILHIETPTVRKHMEHIFEKVGCETRGAAERLALQAIDHTYRLN